MAAPAIQQRERRRHHRYDVRDVRGTLVFPMRVKVLNMSLTGLAIESAKALEIGRRYDLKLQDDRETIQISVDVQWCHLVRTERSGIGEVPAVYQAGLDFRHVLSEQASELLSFLEHHVVVDVERRVFGRFKMALEEPIGLDEHHDFLVRELSYSGMLIETDLMPRVGDAFDLEVHPSGRKLSTRGKVVHAEPLDHKPGCRAGIEFEGMAPETRSALEQVIEGFLE
ncbi:MAG: hypothetical protein GY719_05580 [bacterium]|nr:hypothetical protein [bacterium]